jgi:hypothetical protein
MSYLKPKTSPSMHVTLIAAIARGYWEASPSRCREMMSSHLRVWREAMYARHRRASIPDPRRSVVGSFCNSTQGKTSHRSVF